MFPVEHAADDGRLRKRYPHDAVMTPYERLKSLDGAGRFLKPGVAFADLDRSAHVASDLAAMREVNRAREELFRAIASATDAAKVAFRWTGRSLLRGPAPGVPGNRSPLGRDGARRCAAEVSTIIHRRTPNRTRYGHHPRPQRGVAARLSRVRFADRDASRSDCARLRTTALASPTPVQASRPPLTAAPLRDIGARR